MIKNAFYFILKALFAGTIFKFQILTFWSFRKNWLIRIKRLISKFMTSQSGQQMIYTYCLISRKVKAARQ